jgi:hypothetical protein
MPRSRLLAALVLPVAAALLSLAAVDARAEVPAAVPDPPPPPAQAGDAKSPLTFTGRLRVRYEDWQRGDIAPPSSAWRRAGGDTYVLGGVILGAAYDFGGPLSAVAQIERAEIHDSNFLDASKAFESQVHLHQGFVRYHVVGKGGFDLTIGRQELKVLRNGEDIGSGMVVGNNRFGINTLAFDVAKVETTLAGWDLLGFFGWDAAPDRDFKIDRDENSVGGAHGARLIDAGLTDDPLLLELYAFNRKHQALSLGARLRQSWDDVTADMDFIQQAGSGKGWAFHGAVMWQPHHPWKPRLFVANNIGSGGAVPLPTSPDPDENYQPFGHTGHIYRQSTDFAPYINLRE